MRAQVYSRLKDMVSDKLGNIYSIRDLEQSDAVVHRTDSIHINLCDLTDQSSTQFLQGKTLPLFPVRFMPSINGRCWQ